MVLAAAAARTCLCRVRPSLLGLAAPAARTARLPTVGRWSPGVRALASGAGAEAQPEYLVLTYDYVHHDAELLSQRQPYLDEHLQRCREMADQGKLLLWGAVGRPVDTGMLIWRGADEAEVAAFVKSDPFVRNGLVRHWSIQPFHVHVVDKG